MTEENTAASPEPIPASPSSKNSGKKSRLGLPIIASVLLLSAAGGYGYVWQKQTSLLLTQANKLFAEASKATLAKDGYELKYQGIERAGFPFAAGIKIINPELKFSGVGFKKAFSETLAAASANMNPQQRAVSESIMQSWSESFKVDGNAYFYSNIFTRKIGVNLNGTTSGISDINRSQLAWVARNTTSYLQCSAELTTQAAFNILKKSLAGESVQEALPTGKALELAQCDMSSHQIVSADGKETLFTSNGMHVAMSNTSDVLEHLDGHFVMNLKDALTSQTLVNHYTYLSYGLTGDVGYLNLQQPALLGKQNVDLDIAYKGPTQPAEIFSQNKPLDLKFNRFKITNDAYSIDWPLQLTSDSTNGKNHFNIDTDMRVRFTPVYDQILGHVVRILPKHPAIAQGEIGQAIKKMAEKAGGEEKFSEQLASHLPKPSNLGEIHFTVKSSLESKSAGANDITDSKQLTIDTAEFITDNYGVKVKGAFDASNIKGAVDLTCINCDAMIENGLGYSITLNQFLHSLMPERIVSGYDSTSIGKTKEFIHAISTPETDNPKNRVVNIKDNGNRDLLINGKSMMDVMMLWMKVFVPNSPINTIEGQKAFDPNQFPDVAPPANVKE